MVEGGDFAQLDRALKRLQDIVAQKLERRLLARNENRLAGARYEVANDVGATSEPVFDQIGQPNHNALERASDGPEPRFGQVVQPRMATQEVHLTNDCNTASGTEKNFTSPTVESGAAPTKRRPDSHSVWAFSVAITRAVDATRKIWSHARDFRPRWLGMSEFGSRKSDN